MAEIPDILIFEILLLLPVSSLVRFRCVSKQWRDLIDSADFTKFHFNNRSIKERDRPLMIFYEKSYPYLVKLDSILNDLPPPILKELPIPWWPEGYICHDHGGVGTCNGLICVHDIGHGVIIWNPSTGKHLRFRLPEDLKADNVSIRSWGFGYDRISDDYKVVSVAYWDSGGYDSDPEKADLDRLLVWIYSVKSGSWRNLRDFPYRIRYAGKEGVFAGGALHWAVDKVGGDWRNWGIAALDLRKLKYKVVAVPAEIKEMYSSGISLAAVDGCLCLSYVKRDTGLDLWVMKERGYWTRLIRFAGDISSFGHSLTPLAYADDDGKALLFVNDSNETIRYELETGSFQKVVHYWSTSYLGQPMVYLPTFAWPRTAGNS